MLMLSRFSSTTGVTASNESSADPSSSATCSSMAQADIVATRAKESTEDQRVRVREVLGTLSVLQPKGQSRKKMNEYADVRQRGDVVVSVGSTASSRWECA